MFSNLNANCYNILYLRNHQEKVFCFKNCTDISLFELIAQLISKNLQNCQPSASNFKSFSRSIEQYFFQNRSEQFWKQNTISSSSQSTFLFQSVLAHISLSRLNFWDCPPYLANILDPTLFQKSDNLVQDKSELNLSRAFEYIPLLLCEVHNIAMYFTRVPLAIALPT